MVAKDLQDRMGGMKTTTGNAMRKILCFIGIHQFKLMIKEKGFIGTHIRKCVICKKRQWKTSDRQWLDEEQDRPYGRFS
jgi:hypothetical protein